MDLELYRESKNLTWQQLAEKLGISSASQARRYALGEMWPREDRLDEIIKACGGEVSVYDMHRRRLAFTRKHRKPIADLSVPQRAGRDEVDDGSSEFRVQPVVRRRAEPSSDGCAVELIAIGGLVASGGDAAE